MGTDLGRLGKTRELSETVDTWTCPNELWEEAREAFERSKAKMKEDYDLHRHNNTKYTIGEIIVMTTVPTHTGQSTKLQNKYRGPLTITEVLPGIHHQNTGTIAMKLGDHPGP